MSWSSRSWTLPRSAITAPGSSAARSPQAKRAALASGASGQRVFTGYSPCKNVIAGMRNAAGTRRLVIQEEGFSTQARSANGQCDVSPAAGGTAARALARDHRPRHRGAPARPGRRTPGQGGRARSVRGRRPFDLPATSAAPVRRGNGPRLKAQRDHRVSKQEFVSAIYPRHYDRTGRAATFRRWNQFHGRSLLQPENVPGFPPCRKRKKLGAAPRYASIARKPRTAKRRGDSSIG